MHRWFNASLMQKKNGNHPQAVAVVNLTLK